MMDYPPPGSFFTRGVMKFYPPGYFITWYFIRGGIIVATDVPGGYNIISPRITLWGDFLSRLTGSDPICPSNVFKQNFASCPVDSVWNLRPVHFHLGIIIAMFWLLIARRIFDYEWFTDGTCHGTHTHSRLGLCTHFLLPIRPGLTPILWIDGSPGRREVPDDVFGRRNGL